MNELAIKPQDITINDLGMIMVKSGFFADTKDASQAIVKILAGRELGYGPIASMQNINIIKGKTSMAANLVGSSIKRSGRYDYRVIKLDDTACELAFYEQGKEVGKSSFTMKDAQQAGLAGGDNWRKFPRNMLFSRALTNGARWYCPDVFNGPIYTPDELGAVVDGETYEVVQTPQPAQLPPAKTKDPLFAEMAKDFDNPLPDKLDYTVLGAAICFMTNSDGVLYTDLPTDKLSFMANAMTKKLEKNGLDPEEASTLADKLAAAKSILEFRAAHHDA